MSLSIIQSRYCPPVCLFSVFFLHVLFMTLLCYLICNALIVSGFISVSPVRHTSDSSVLPPAIDIHPALRLSSVISERQTFTRLLILLCSVQILPSSLSPSSCHSSSATAGSSVSLWFHPLSVHGHALARHLALPSALPGGKVPSEEGAGERRGGAHTKPHPR